MRKSGIWGMHAGYYTQYCYCQVMDRVVMVRGKRWPMHQRSFHQKDHDNTFLYECTVLWLWITHHCCCTYTITLVYIYVVCLISGAEQDTTIQYLLQSANVCILNMPLMNLSPCEILVICLCLPWFFIYHLPLLPFTWNCKK